MGNAPGFNRRIVGLNNDYFLEPNADGSLTILGKSYVWDGSAWVPDEGKTVYEEIEASPDVVTTVDLSNPALLSIASVSASVGKTATTTVAISTSALVITRSVA